MSNSQESTKTSSSKLKNEPTNFNQQTNQSENLSEISLGENQPLTLSK